MSKKTTSPPSIPIPASGRLGSLLRVPVDYLLEVYRGNQITTMIALPNTPNAVTQTRNHATELTHTLGDVVRELSQNHRTDIQLRGVSGYAQRTGQTRDGGVVVSGGRTILEEFDKFLDDYQRDASADPDNTFMVYRALGEGYAFKVEPLVFRWSEDSAENRFSYLWELTLEAYAGAPKSPRPSIFSPVTEAIRKASEYIAAGAGLIAVAQNAATNTRSELEEARNLLRSMSVVVTTLSSAVRSVDGVSRFFSRDLPASWAQLSQSYLRAVREIEELTADSTLSTSAEQLNVLALNTAGLVGVNRQNFERAGFGERALDRVVENSEDRPRFHRQITLRAGDSVQAISARVFGDPSRFGELIAYNRLLDATHHADGSPLRAGDAIFVPFAASGADDLGLPRDGDLFGRDLRIDEQGDLVLGEEDLALAEGRRNLEQAIRLRLLSTQGSSWVLPAYGLPVGVGAPLTSRVASYCASSIDDQLLQDARIERVSDIVITEDGDVLTASATLTPLSGGSMALIVPIG